jgi:nicotinamidase-related amidase
MCPEADANPLAAARLLNQENAVLLVVDIQERFLPVLSEPEMLLERTGILIAACSQLHIPVLVTEQYPKGLGPTAGQLLQALPPSALVMEKAAFGCGQEPEISARLSAMKRPQVMVCGIEAHICVNQTVHQLLALGFQVHLMLDAIRSRHNRDREIAVAKMQQSGAIPSGVEMALFELLGTSRHPQFKSVQALVK